MGSSNSKRPEGWLGWDAYAAFYDWENRRTMGRRDVAFWRTFTRGCRGPVLELGCGTGRVSRPLAASGVSLVGIDRSASMLARARSAAELRRARRSHVRRGEPTLTRGDIRELPFRSDSFEMVMAPYGVLQSLVRESDLRSALTSIARVVRPGGAFGIDLVPDVPRWREYQDRQQFSGRLPDGAELTLVETVKQDRRRRLTFFSQRYIVRRGSTSTEHPFDLTFRTLTIVQLRTRLLHAGFVVDAVLGDYEGGPWTEDADTWLVLARRPANRDPSGVARDAHRDRSSRHPIVRCDKISRSIR